MARPLIPIEAGLLKQLLRSGLDSQISRAYWWPILPTLRPDVLDVIIQSDNDIEGSAERLHELLQEPLLDFKLTTERESEFVEQGARKLASVLVARKKVDEVDVNYWLPLARILLWQIRRVDVVYAMVSTMLDQPDR
jgi:hypothetical protein